ncbi:helix-turn-helix domain-containing protein [Lelliottia wanjuensis]|uniref:helix-turn-helix domain-containing protein n=1 Tax=Lelliottia wanjuensis TaxID=3050585 RepID=UPI00254ABDB2|nr:helix-turn-helix domain-containing protein [Lelliottia sp. V104_15]MDK9604605.1 helix-turn-helix domain-containing protein [Lelliottia sp. V104_15]
MKPLDEIIQLVNSISAGSEYKENKRKNIFIHVKTHHCLIIHSGVFSIYRESDGLFLSHHSGPMILGLNMIAETTGVYMKTLIQVSVEYVELDQSIKRIYDHALWEQLAHYYMYLTYLLRQGYCSLVGHSVKEVIINCLIKLKSEDKKIRNNISALIYVMEKSNLSRSSVFKHFALLKKSDALRIKKGMLESFTDESMDFS